MYAALTLLAGGAWGAIQQDPVNPHYFYSQGSTAALVGSTEHYGAVMNLDFDYKTYLSELSRVGLKVTRTWSGMMYLETPLAGGGKLAHNTMGPFPGRYLSPFSVSSQCCYNYTAAVPKFDLTQWNETYFERLQDFVQYAAASGVVVEFGLFSNMYGEGQWALSTVNPGNNINGVGATANYTDLYTLAHPEITAVQLSFIQKVASVLSPYDNLYYELVNEPYINQAQGINVTAAWLLTMATALQAADSAGGNPHLIQQDVCNNGCVVNGTGQGNILSPFTHVVSMHYSTPQAVQQNYALPLIFNDGETGFSGSDDAPYRTQGWLYMLGGGGGYINLDYSFTIYHPDGTDTPVVDPGGGSPALRQSLGALQRLLDTLPLRTCSPLALQAGGVVVSAHAPADASLAVQALICGGSVMAGYISSNITDAGANTATVSLSSPLLQQSLTLTWLSPSDGSLLQPPTVVNTNGQGALVINTPQQGFGLDVAWTLAPA